MEGRKESDIRSAGQEGEKNEGEKEGREEEMKKRRR